MWEDGFLSLSCRPNASGVDPGLKGLCFITGETKGFRDKQNCKNSDYFQNKGSRFGWLALE